MSWPLRTLLLTGFAMAAFAANSVIGRFGLTDTQTGAGTFALIRVVSGAAMLAALMVWQGKRPLGTWAGAGALAVYILFFSYAYISLPAGTGALILFGIVQIVMIGAGRLSGEQMDHVQWLGAVLAMAALIWLISPGLAAPPLLGAAAMAFAGVGWGAYSLIGRGSADAAAATAGNFLRAAALCTLAIIPVFVLRPEPLPDAAGIGLAILSGAVTSGLGYIIWYAALKYLSATQAGLAQLSVPALAAIGGAAFLAEPITLRLTVASLAILGGVALATLPRANPR